MSLKSYNSRSNFGMQFYFDDFITRDQWRATHRARGVRLMTFPAVNIFETNNALMIELVAPGVDPSFLQIEVNENGLCLSYDPGNPDFIPVTKHRVLRNEFSTIPFQRKFELNPNSLIMDQVEIESENGVIQLTIPKLEEYCGRLSTPNYFSIN